MADQQTSGYFRVGGRVLYGTWFAPSAPPRAAAVLFEPFGEEKKSALRLMVRLARALAARGVGVFRFDHSGSGESGGDSAAASWDEWLQEAEAAVFSALRLGGTPGWVAVGVRLGGLPALHAARLREAAAVSLIEPILTGEECLRDLERRQRIKQVVSGVNTAEEDSARRWARGEAADFGGIAVGPRLAEGLRPESVVGRLGQLGPECPVQLLRVSGSPGFPAAWKPLVERAQAVPPGEAAVVRDKPFWGQLEYYESDLVLDRVTEFAAAVFGAAGPAAATGGPGS